MPAASLVQRAGQRVKAEGQTAHKANAQAFTHRQLQARPCEMVNRPKRLALTYPSQQFIEHRRGWPSAEVTSTRVGFLKSSQAFDAFWEPRSERSFGLRIRPSLLAPRTPMEKTDVKNCIFGWCRCPCFGFCVARVSAAQGGSSRSISCARL